jgi:hypothetical protein
MSNGYLIRKPQLTIEIDNGIRLPTTNKYNNIPT